MLTENQLTLFSLFKAAMKQHNVSREGWLKVKLLEAKITFSETWFKLNFKLSNVCLLKNLFRTA
jgi:hypothetical protein